jgi:hypothetical protein
MELLEFQWFLSSCWRTSGIVVLAVVVVLGIGIAGQMMAYEQYLFAYNAPHYVEDQNPSSGAACRLRVLRATGPGNKTGGHGEAFSR